MEVNFLEFEEWCMLEIIEGECGDCGDCEGEDIFFFFKIYLCLYEL